METKVKPTVNQVALKAAKEKKKKIIANNSIVLKNEQDKNPGRAKR